MWKDNLDDETLLYDSCLVVNYLLIYEHMVLLMAMC